jgi:hypothetical protein
MKTRRKTRQKTHLPHGVCILLGGNGGSDGKPNEHVSVSGSRRCVKTKLMAGTLTIRWWGHS